MTIRTAAVGMRPRVTALAALVLVAACPPGREEARARSSGPPPATPAEFAEGERLFDAACASCHGQYARGTDRGPPLVHPYYKPSHHADAAFYFASERGVVQHHWHFGNMPAQPAVRREAMTRIIAYVRWLQRQAGIE